MVDYIVELLEGLWMTFQMSGMGLALGFAIGLFLAIAQLHGGRAMRIVSSGYVELVRGTPLLVQLFIVYFGLLRFGIGRVAAATLALGLNSGAYQAEYFRGAMESIGAGQMAAARSTGMTKWQAIRHIVVPQALRLALPAWSNEAAYLPKYSSSAFLIAVPELLSRASIVVGRTFRPFEVYAIVGIIYLACIGTLSKVLDVIYERVKIPGY